MGQGQEEPSVAAARGELPSCEAGRRGGESRGSQPPASEPQEPALHAGWAPPRRLRTAALLGRALSPAGSPALLLLLPLGGGGVGGWGGRGWGGRLRRGRVWERGKQTPGRAGELQASGGPPEGDGHSGPHRGYNVRDEAKPRCVPAAAHEQRKAGLALPQEDAYSVVLLVVISVAMASCCLCPLALPHIGHVLSRITLL